MFFNRKQFALARQQVIEVKDSGELIADGLVGVASAAEMLNNVMGMILVISANAIARKASDVSLY